MKKLLFLFTFLLSLNCFSQYRELPSPEEVAKKGGAYAKALEYLKQGHTLINVNMSFLSDYNQLRYATIYPCNSNQAEGYPKRMENLGWDIFDNDTIITIVFNDANSNVYSIYIMPYKGSKEYFEIAMMAGMAASEKSFYPYEVDYGVVKKITFPESDCKYFFDKTGFLLPNGSKIGFQGGMIESVYFNNMVAMMPLYRKITKD